MESHSTGSMPPSPPLLDAELAAFLEGGVSITAGGRDARMVPTLARALGCRVAADRRQVTLYFSRRQAQALLEAIEANGALAAVFNEPRTHRALQLKGTDARRVPFHAEDLARVEAYRADFIRDVAPLGFQPPLVQALLAAPEDDLAAVAFTPSAAHLQTPGPQAGSRLEERP